MQVSHDSWRCSLTGEMIDPQRFAQDDGRNEAQIALIVLPDLTSLTIPEDQLLLGLAEVCPGKRSLGGLSTGRDRSNREFYILDLLEFVRRLTMQERAKVLKQVHDRLGKEIINLLIEVLKPAEMIELLELLQDGQDGPDGDRVFAAIIAALPMDKYNALLMETRAFAKILPALTHLFELAPGNA